ncbi:MAG TPA: carboxypeptidase-like regulatory domain-containing protein, partial [Nitrososphaera sp.]|nr:carboxypeptidase-like regulatory domain-containing protein [Nitrososphaera sp.]
MKSASRIVFLLIAVFSLAGTQFLFAQGTDLGTIRGTVTDSSGAVVPNAKVTVTDLGTGSTRETTTNAQGDYQIFGLSSGTYKVSVANAGMTTVQVNGIVVNGSAVVIANAIMKVASASETVDVTTEAPTINTADQT